jgi:integrase
VDLEGGVWRIPIEETKSTRAHKVPLSPLAIEVLRELLPADGGPPTGLVFKGRGGKPMTGWSKRMKRPGKNGPAGLAVETAKLRMAPWGFHDLRRTLRSGYAALKVPEAVAEMALNHAVKGTLIAAYDKYDYWKERVEAARTWDRKVRALVMPEQTPDVSNVVKIPAT